MNWRNDTGDYESQTDKASYILNQMSWLPKWASVLDVGCHGGRDLIALHNAGYRNLYGIDVHDAVNTIPWPIVTIRSNLDILRRFGDMTFDLIMSVATLEHIEDRSSVAEIGRVAGHWIVTVCVEGAVGENYHPFDLDRLWPDWATVRSEESPVYRTSGGDLPYVYRTWHRK